MTRYQAHLGGLNFNKNRKMTGNKAHRWSIVIVNEMCYTYNSMLERMMMFI